MKSKKLLQFIFLTIALLSTNLSCEESCEESRDVGCGTYNGHQLFKGSKGGCYYYNSNDNKTYVDRPYYSC